MTQLSTLSGGVAPLLKGYPVTTSGGAVSKSTNTALINYLPDALTTTVLKPSDFIAIFNAGSTCYGNSTYVATYSSIINICAYSTNGTTWTNATMPYTTTWGPIAFNGTYFFAVSTTELKGAYSSDGITWTGIVLPILPTNILAIGSKIVISNAGLSASSTNNGTTWNVPIYGPLPVPPTTVPGNWPSIAYSPTLSIFVAASSVASGGVAWSTDGVAWTQTSTGNAQGPYINIIWSNGYFIALGNTSSIQSLIYSTDGKNWSRTSQNTLGSNGGQAFNGSVYVSTLTGSSIAVTTGITTGSAIVRSTVYTLPISATWTGVAWNGTVFCALASGNAICATSPDGITWTSRTMPTSTTWSKIVWNGTVFCAISSTSGTIAATSPDGTSWTPRTLPVSTTWVDLAWSGTQFILISSAGGIAATSPDGITWTQRVMPALAWGGVCASTTKIIASISANSNSVGISVNGGISWSITAAETQIPGTTIGCSNNNSTLFVSLGVGLSIGSTTTDGINWTQYNLPIAATWSGIAHNGTVFCAVSSGSAIAITSTDGTTWTQQALPVSSNWSAIAWNGTVFCAVSSTSGTIAATSPDGTTWTARVLPQTNIWTSIVAKGATFCAVGPQSTATSTDGVTWVLNSPFNLPIVPTSWNDVAWNGTVFCAVSSTASAVAATSPDGITWTSRTLPVSSTWSAIAWNGTVFCAISSTSGTIAATSPDGTTWTARTLSAVGTWADIAWNGTVFCAISSTSGTLASTSPDGTTWTTRTLSATTTWNKIAVLGTTFCVLSSAAGTIASTSTDGTTWTARTLPTSTTWSNITASSTQFCAVATGGTVAATSPDGTTWTARILSASNTWNSVIWHKAFFMAFNAAAGAVSTSPDGITWTSRTLTGLFIPTTAAVVSNGTIICSIGQSTTGFSSTSPDGITWSSKGIYASGSWLLAASSNIFCAINTASSSYIYTSADGITWTQRPTCLASTQWGAISWNGTVFHVLFTASANTLAMTSPDGITWSQQAIPVSRQFQPSLGFTPVWKMTARFGSNILVQDSVGSNILSPDNGVSWNTLAPSFAPGIKACDGLSTTGVVLGGNNLVYSISSTGLWTNSFLSPVGSLSTGTPLNIAYNGSKYSLTPQSGYLSTDGTTWSKTGFFSTNNTCPVAANTSIFCALPGRTAAQWLGHISTDGLTWQPTQFPALGTIWSAIAWNGTIFCAISSSSSIAATSPDGKIWTQQSMPTLASWSTIAWNGTIFCAIASNAAIAATSPDGITWTLRVIPLSVTWASKSLAWNGNLFCAVSSTTGTTAITSPDGITWTLRTLPISLIWIAIVALGTKFCALASDMSTIPIATSTDGITWAPQGVPNVTSYSDIVSTGTLLCAVATGGTIAMTSPNGSSWTPRDLPISTTWYTIAWNGTKFCALSTNNNMATSTDGITWVTNNGASSVGTGYIGSVNNIFTTTNGFYSSNGNVWSTSKLLNTGGGPISGSGTALVGTTNAGVTVYTADGNNWTETGTTNIAGPGVNTNGYLTYQYVGYGSSMVYGIQPVWYNDRYLVISGTTCKVSLDGITWSSSTFPGGAPTALLVIDTGFLALIQNTSIVWKSTDGINWTSYTISSGAIYSFVDPIKPIWTGTKIIAAQFSSNSIFTSTDGITWNTYSVGNIDASNNLWRRFAALNSSTVLLFAAMGDTSGTPIRIPMPYKLSLDSGSTWTTNYLPNPISGNMFAAASNNTVLCIAGQGYYSAISGGNGGQFNSPIVTSWLLTTTDGINWTEIKLPISSNWGNMIWTGSLFILASTTIMVTSPDGIIWTIRKKPEGKDLNWLISGPSGVALSTVSKYGYLSGVPYSKGYDIVKLAIDTTKYEVPIVLDAGIAASISYT